MSPLLARTNRPVLTTCVVWHRPGSGLPTVKPARLTYLGNGGLSALSQLRIDPVQYCSLSSRD